MHEGAGACRTRVSRGSTQVLQGHLAHQVTAAGQVPCRSQIYLKGKLCVSNVSEKPLLGIIDSRKHKEH